MPVVDGMLDALRLTQYGLLVIGARHSLTMRRWSNRLWEDVGAGLAWRAQCSVALIRPSLS